MRRLLKKLKLKTKKQIKTLSESEGVKKTREKFFSLEASTRSKLAKAVALLLVVVVIWQLSVKWAEKEKERRKTEVKEEEITVEFDETLLKDTWIERASKTVARHEQEINEIKSEISSFKENLQNIEKLLSGLNKKLEAGVPVRETEKETEEKEEKKEEIPQKVEKLYRKAPKEITPPKPMPFLPQAPSGQQARKPQQGPGMAQMMGGLIYADYTPPEKETVSGQKGLKEMLYLPPGSFARSVVLTGVFAPTGMKAKTHPQPVVFMAKDLAFLPNDYRVNVDRCLMVGEAYGELASERVYVRINRVSCITKDRKILVAQAQGPLGYVVDIDGNIGLSGRIVSRRGLFLARSLVANFVEGVARAFRASLTTVSVTPLGGTVQESSGSDAWKVALGEGVGKTLEGLAKMYQELASQTFPVIVVPAGRTAHVVLLSPVEIKTVGILSEKPSERKGG